MALYDEGTTLVLTGTFRDGVTNDLVDPDEVQCRVEKPSGEVFHLDAVRESEGVYAVEIVPDEGGVWEYAFVSIGAIQAAKTMFFNVKPGIP